MSVSSIKAGKAFYEIFAEDKTSKGLQSAAAGLKNFGARIAGVGAAMSGFAAAGLTGLTALVKGFAGAGDDLQDAMSVTGLSSDFLQTLKFGAADAGVEFNALQAAVGKMSNVLTDAAAGSKSANASLANLGLNIKQLAGMTQDQRFAAIADGISKISDPAKRAAAAMDIFGKSGAKLLPVLEGGAQGLADAMKDMQERGLILSPEDIKLAAKANGAFLMLAETFSHIKNLIGAAVAPVFLQVASVVQSAAESVARFITNNRGLFAGLAIGLGVLGAVGLALVGIGGAAALAGLALSGVAAIGTALATAIAVITSPITLIIAAIVGLGVATGVAVYHLDQLYNGGKALEFLKNAALGAWSAVSTLWKAIANGRWDLAGNLIGNGLQVGFQGAILWIKEAWNEMTIWMVERFADAMKRVEAQMPKWLADKLGLGGKLDNVTAGMRARGDAGLADDRAAATKAFADLGETLKKINQLPDKKITDALKLPFGGTDGGLIGGLMQDRLDSGSAGAFNSAAAARLGFAAPANSVQEKQLDVLQMIHRGIEDVVDGVNGLDGLAAD